MNASNNHTLIEAQNLKKSYGDKVAVDTISFGVYAGEIFGFLGPNGAGKTTTIKMIVGLLEPTSGTVRVAGYDVQTQPVLAKAASGYVPDTSNLYPKLSAKDLLRFVGDLYEMDRQQVERRIDEFLKLFDLTDAANDTIDSYSHGMQQKTALAAALIHDPQVLVLDEPTNDLDMETLDLLQELIADFKGTVLLVSHDRELMDKLCHRTIFIKPPNIEVRKCSYSTAALEIKREIQIAMFATGSSKLQDLRQKIIRVN